MSSRLGSLLAVLSSIVATLLVGAVAVVPYTYTEGFQNKGDVVFADCTYNVKGEWGTVLRVDLPFKLDSAGGKITYINVENNKPKDQQGTVIKTDGGTGFNYVNFRAKSVEGHGFLFHFDIRGTIPPGAIEKQITGNCS